jgi:hypothetical protein
MLDKSFNEFKGIFMLDFAVIAFGDVFGIHVAVKTSQ